jgi:hypothetical protein
VSTGWWLLGAAAVIGVAGDQARRLGPLVSPKVELAGVEAHETHASASLLGQFRTSAATWLYLHADLYLHNGVEMRPLTGVELRTGERGQTAGSSDLGAGEGSGETTVIPSADKDFRGWIGDLERACGAYKDMRGHRHNPPETAMPLFQLMTTIDPTFIPGWTMGAMIIARKPKTGAEAAIKFLKRGVAENPDEFRLRYETGFYLAAHDRELAEALPWLEAARRLGSGRKDLSLDESESLQDDYRWLALCYRNLGNHAQQWAIAKEGIARFPSDPVLLRLAQKS